MSEEAVKQNEGIRICNRIAEVLAGKSIHDKEANEVAVRIASLLPPSYYVAHREGQYEGRVTSYKPVVKGTTFRKQAARWPSYNEARDWAEAHCQGYPARVVEVSSGGCHRVVLCRVDGDKQYAF